MSQSENSEPELMCDLQILSGILRLGAEMWGYGADYEISACFSSDGYWATTQGLAEKFIREDKNRAIAVIRAARRALKKLGLGMRYEHKRKDGTRKWVILPLKGQSYESGKAL